MRRKDREVKDFKKILEIVDACRILRLGLNDGEYPYIVPLNFAYEVQGDTLYLYVHGAMAGKKYELLQKNPYCSFEMDHPLELELMPAVKDVTQRYESVMGKAVVEFVENSEKENIVDRVIMSRDERTRGYDYNRKALAKTAILRLRVTELSAKRNPSGGNAD